VTVILIDRPPWGFYQDRWCAARDSNPEPAVKSRKFTHSGGATWDFNCSGFTAEEPGTSRGSELMDSSMDKIRYG
jgi:hypothetical protein